MNSRKILLTGFEPFKKEAINPSKEIVLRLGPQLGIDHLILPVSYQRSAEVLTRALSQKSYDFILMLGEAGKRSNISLERNAVNRILATIADEDGVESNDRRINGAGSDSYQARADIENLFSFLNAQNFPVEISESAGTYVCNHLYYQVCEMLQKSSSNTEALFVHVPYLPEQTVNKPEGTPSLPLATMTATIGSLIKKIGS